MKFRGGLINLPPLISYPLSRIGQSDLKGFWLDNLGIIDQDFKKLYFCTDFFRTSIFMV